MKTISTLFIAFVLFVSCGQASRDKEMTEEVKPDSPETAPVIPPSSSAPMEAYRKEQVKLLIGTTKETIDSIDAAYKTIFNTSRQLTLSLDEREQVNQVLQELSNAKDLIVLETQAAVIDQLRTKTNLLKEVLTAINEKSEHLTEIAKTLAKISTIIEKTTNTLADALTFGIVRPKIE